MNIYDVHGNKLVADNGALETPYLSSSARPRLKEQSDFDMSSFDTIRTFTAFSTDYATPSGQPYVLNMTSAEFLEIFYEPYLGYHSDMVVTKKNLGRDESDTYDIWCYDFIPYNAKKKILLSSGMHTYELPASFGLARWIKDYMESSDAVFQYMRQNVQISVIPIVNPWGWNQTPNKKYGNYNGVNPNRNFNNWADAWQDFPEYSPDPTSPNYNEWNVKGDAPFSEAETQILAEWLKANTDAQFWIDCHTGVGVTRANSGDVWCIYVAGNVLANKIQNAATAIGGYIQSTYSRTPKYNVVTDSPNSIKSMYGDQVVGVPTMVIEQATGTDTLMTTMPNNSKPAIQYYALQIHAYIVSQLK